MVALDGTSARLADVTGAATVMLTGHLLADPGFELVTSHRRVPLAASGLEHLPEEVRASAQWWEQHLTEVLTGVPPGSPPGTAPRPEYDPPARSLRQRELAKDARAARGRAPGRAGHAAAAAAPLRARRAAGAWSTGGAAAAGPRAGRPVDPRVIAAIQQAIGEETDRSTGTVGRLRRRVEQILAADQAATRPAMPPRATFYRLAAQLSAGRHTFGSAPTRRSLAKRPDGPFGAVTVARPGSGPRSTRPRWMCGWCWMTGWWTGPS